MEKNPAWSCPRCRTDMIRGRFVILSNWHCPACDFDWISGEALAAFLPTVRAFEKLRASAVSGAASTRSLRCPSCLSESYRAVEAGGAEIDVCAKCVGVALDPGEMQAVKSLGYGKAERTVDVVSGIEALAQILALFF